MSEREKFTPGPWRWELSRVARKVELCGGGMRKGTYDWRVLSFRRWGTQDAQPEFWTWEGNIGTPELAKDLAAPVKDREHHADWFATINHPDAILIANAPNLYEALDVCERALTAWAGQVTTVDLTHAEQSLFAAQEQARAALAKAVAQSGEPSQQTDTPQDVAVEGNQP